MARGAASVGVTTMRAHKLDRNNSDESPSGRDLALRRVVGMGVPEVPPPGHIQGYLLHLRGRRLEAPLQRGGDGDLHAGCLLWGIRRGSRGELSLSYRG